MQTQKRPEYDRYENRLVLCATGYIGLYRFICSKNLIVYLLFVHIFK